MNKIVIADADPSIAFARLHQIRQAVNKKQLELRTAPDFSAYAQKIDAGEASAIALAIEYGCGVLMDNKAGRKMATNAVVPVIGTVGVLVLAKRKGLIPQVMPQLKALSISGFFLSEEIIAAALAASGE